MSRPEPPVNVRVVKQDGRVLPVECVYQGQDIHGTHLWEAVAPIVYSPTHDVVKADKIPAHTAIKLRLPEPEEDL